VADPGVLLVARVHGLEGRARELAAAAARLAEQARAQDGAAGFDVLAVPGDPAELVLLAGWRDETALRAHLASEPYGAWVVAVTGLLARPSDVVVHRVAGTVHPVADLSSEPGRAS
jgi:quinol monooxygenase YgiN